MFSKLIAPPFTISFMDTKKLPEMKLVEVGSNILLKSFS